MKFQKEVISKGDNFALNYWTIATGYIYIAAKMGHPDANLLTLKGNKLVDFSKKTQETWRFKQAFSSASTY